MYKSGLAIFKDNPIFGVGNKNYRVITTKNIETKINDNYVLNTHPHQIYIELLSEHGLVGSIILLSIFYTKCLLEEKRHATEIIRDFVC